MDGIRREGTGWTYIEFLTNGNVALFVADREKAEYLALRKNFGQEVTAGGVTLSIRDFSFNHHGVPSYSESLSVLVNSLVHQARDEEEAKKVLEQLESVVIAAHRRVHDDLENLGRNEHARFRTYVIHLSKKLGRPPKRSEIRNAFYSKGDAKKITKLCEANGLGWLPSGHAGRPKK